MQTDFVVRNLCFFTCINTIAYAQEPYVLYNYGTDKNIHDEMAHLSKVITVLLASSFESLIHGAERDRVESAAIYAATVSTK